MNRKYPWKMFVFFVLMNFIIRYFYLFVPGVILSLIGIGNQVCLALGLTLLTVDLILSVIEQLRIRKTALRESDNQEFNELMDAFYGPEGPEAFQKILKEKLNTADEISDLEQENDRRQEFLQSLTVYRQLKSSISHSMTLDEMMEAFQAMCQLSVGEPDDLLFETGTYEFTDEKLFYFTLARQFQFMDDCEYVQLRLDVMYLPSAKTKYLYGVKWGKLTEGDFWSKVRRSRAYRVAKQLPVHKVSVHIDDT